jgi:hypothetical protein
MDEPRGSARLRMDVSGQSRSAAGPSRVILYPVLIVVGTAAMIAGVLLYRTLPFAVRDVFQLSWPWLLVLGYVVILARHWKDLDTRARASLSAVTATFVLIALLRTAIVGDVLSTWTRTVLEPAFFALMGLGCAVMAAVAWKERTRIGGVPRWMVFAAVAAWFLARLAFEATR